MGEFFNHCEEARQGKAWGNNNQKHFLQVYFHSTCHSVGRSPKYNWEPKNHPFLVFVDVLSNYVLKVSRKAVFVFFSIMLLIVMYCKHKFEKIVS